MVALSTGIDERYAPPWRIQLKARVDLGDQTAKFIPFEVIRTAISTVAKPPPLSGSYVVPIDTHSAIPPIILTLRVAC